MLSYKRPPPVGAAPVAAIDAVPGLGPRFRTWLRQRIPPARSVQLTQRNVFIFPTFYGGLFGLFLALLLVAAINYQNSLIFALTFLLASVFSASILQTFRNLAGLTVHGRGAEPVFAGARLSYGVRLEAASGRRYIAVRIGWPGGTYRTLQVPPRGTVDVELLREAPRRGLDRPGRIRIETRYPTGLLQAWSWLDLDAEAIVYPRPLEVEVPERNAPEAGSAATRQQVTGEDLWGLRTYQIGDSPRRVAWKQFARRDQLVTKVFEQPLGQATVLDWDAVSGDVELRLSRLCGQVLALERAQRTFTLRLPGTEIGPGQGHEHVGSCLRALALHGIEA